MVPCLVCKSEDWIDYIYPPYVTCTNCQHTYQPELPPKTWMNSGDGNSNGYSGAVMDEQEKSANAYLANWIFTRYHPKRTLDVGSGYPYLASRFAFNGSEAHAVDGGFYEDLISVDDIHDVKTAAMDWEEDNLPWEGKFDLITMIHVFEHMYHPEQAAKKAFDLLNPEGVLYVRLPNKDVTGIERDHTEEHAKIHPNIYGTTSLLRVMQKAGFFCIWLEHQPGYGQSNFIFRKRLPKISLFMITKNEEGNIGPCLDSVRSVCDEMIVLDTGSTDNTIAEAEEHGAIVHRSGKFNKDTTYTDFHFAEARNEAMKYCDPNTDWLFWMDADDIFDGQLMLSPLSDAYSVMVEYGNQTLKHFRYFRKGWVLKFNGAIHEAPDISQCRSSDTKTCKIIHRAGVKQGRVERNISILESEYKNDPENLRTVFYLANCYKDANQFEKAISKYKKYIDSGGNFHDELVVAYFYMANCYYCLGEYKEAIKWSFKGLCIDDRHAELYCRIGESYMGLGNYKRAIHYFKIALDLPGKPATCMWVHDNFYKEVPEYRIKICNLKMNDHVSSVDPFNGRKIIELVRPGALGDIIASTPSVAQIRQENPDAWIRYVCHPSGFELIQRNPDVDEIAAESGKCAVRKYFEYPMTEGYPDVPMSKHLAEHFADSANVTLPDDWRCRLDLPGLDHGFNLPEKYITFAVKTGWSEYKEWPLYRWESLINKMRKEHPDIAWVQLGGPDEPDIEKADYNLNGMTDLTQSFQVLACSMMFVGLDSVFNHACNALQIPAVIMFGSTHPQGSGYPEATNLVANLECQPCIAGNMLIQTKDGFKRMDLITNSDMVLTSDGLYHRVVDSWYSGYKESIEIEMTNGLKLVCTPNHKILVVKNKPYDKKNKRITKVSAIELENGDWIVNQPAIIKELDESNIAFPNGFVVDNWSADLGYVMGFALGDGSYSNWKDIKQLTIKARNDEDLICLERCRKFINQVCSSNNKIRYRFKNQIPPGGTDPIEYVEWSCSWRRRSLTDLFSELGFDKTKPLRCPTAIFGAPLETVSGFLSGLFDADGSVTILNKYDKRNDNIYVSAKINLSSAYKKLLEDVQILLCRFGIHSSICTVIRTLPDKTKSIYYRLDIASSVSQQLFRDFIGFTHKAKSSKLQNIPIKTRSRYPIVRIKEIRNVGKRDVYDIAVEGKHDFSANGILVSNCYRENNEISVHPMPPCPFSHKCMREFMTVSKVMEAVEAKLKNTLNVEV